MKFLIGFTAGLGAAWAALAIWQHRATPDVKPPTDAEDVIEGIRRTRESYRGRPSFDDAAADPLRGGGAGFGGGR